MRWIWTLLAISHPLQSLAAWTQKEDDILIINSFNYYHTDTYWDIFNNKNKQNQYHKISQQTYFEYGYLPELTIGLIAEQAYAKQMLIDASKKSRNYDLDGISFFTRIQIGRKDNSVMSVQPLFKLGMDNGGTPAIGTTDNEIELRLQYGYNFAEGYVTIEPAYRHRMGNSGDQVRFSGKLAHNFGENWQALGEFDQIFGKSAKVDEEFILQDSNDFDQSRIALSGIYNLEQDKIQFGIYSHFAGENTGAGGGIFAAYHSKFTAEELFGTDEE